MPENAPPNQGQNNVITRTLSNISALITLIRANLILFVVAWGLCLLTLVGVVWLFGSERVATWIEITVIDEFDDDKILEEHIKQHYYSPYDPLSSIRVQDTQLQR